MDDNNGNGPIALAGDAGPADQASGSEPAEDDIKVAAGDIYASVRGTRLAIAIEFIRQDGRSFSVPYSYLPLLWWHPPGLLLIEYPNLFSVLLKAREIDDLRRRIRDQRIIWVREIGQREAERLASAVTSIEIIRFFPSRETGIDPPTELVALFAR